MKSERPRPYVMRLHQLVRALSSVEGWAFGRLFRFGHIGYGDFGIDLGAWQKVDVLSGVPYLPGLDQLAKDLNAATAPVLEAYAETLRAAIARECLRTAEAATSPHVPNPD